jgi:DNA-binding response OmpR family regulator
MNRINEDKIDHIRILLVDDEEGFVSILSKRMSRRKFDVTAANSGAEAIKILRDKDFDIALLDLKMEGLDGIEVLKVFKMMAPELPVIILTGHGAETAATEGEKYGAADYICKPYDFEQLVKKIRSTLKRE